MLAGIIVLQKCLRIQVFILVDSLEHRLLSFDKLRMNGKKIPLNLPLPKGEAVSLLEKGGLRGI